MSPILYTLPLILFLAAPLGAQELYKWKDGNGRWYFSDRRPPGEAEKVTFKESPNPMPVPVLPCATFAPGDSRAALGYGLGVHSPIQVEDVYLKRLDSESGTGLYSWKLVLQNGSDREVIAGAVLRLADCGEAVIAEERIPPQTLAPFEARTVNGTKVIHGPGAEKVARFLVQVGAKP